MHGPKRHRDRCLTACASIWCAFKHGKALASTKKYYETSRRQKTQKNAITKQRGAKHSVCEQELSGWVSSQQRMGLTVSHLDLQREMRRLVDDSVAFRVSNSSVQGSKRRFRLSFRRTTTRSMAVLNYLREPISEVQENSSIK